MESATTIAMTNDDRLAAIGLRLAELAEHLPDKVQDAVLLAVETFINTIDEIRRQ